MNPSIFFGSSPPSSGQNWNLKEVTVLATKRSSKNRTYTLLEKSRRY